MADENDQTSLEKLLEAGWVALRGDGYVLTPAGQSALRRGIPGRQYGPNGRREAVAENVCNACGQAITDKRPGRCALGIWVHVSCNAGGDPALWDRLESLAADLRVEPMLNETTEPDIGEPLAHAMSDYMMAAFGRRPTTDEMWEIYWAAVDAIEDVATRGCGSRQTETGRRLRLLARLQKKAADHD